MPLTESRLKNYMSCLGNEITQRLAMLLVVDLFVAEITKQKFSPEQTSILRLKIFSSSARYTDPRCLYHPNECLESFQYKNHNIK